MMSLEDIVRLLREIKDFTTEDYTEDSLQLEAEDYYEQLLRKAAEDE